MDLLKMQRHTAVLSKDLKLLLMKQVRREKKYKERKRGGEREREGNEERNKLEERRKV
jgi:hypothetical protein